VLMLSLTMMGIGPLKSMTCFWAAVRTECPASPSSKVLPHSCNTPQIPARPSKKIWSLAVR